MQKVKKYAHMLNPFLGNGKIVKTGKQTIITKNNIDSLLSKYFEITFHYSL